MSGNTGGSGDAGDSSRLESSARLVLASRDGDHGSFGELVEAFTPLVTRVVAAQGVEKGDLDEVVQDVFVRAYFSLSSFDTRRPFEPWISGVAYRTAKDYFRKRGRFKEVDMSSLLPDDSDAATVLGGGEDPADLAQQSSIRDAVLTGLGELTAAQRLVIVLYYFEEMSVREICRATEWSASKVKVTLYRARKSLRRFLAPIMEE